MAPSLTCNGLPWRAVGALAIGGSVIFGSLIVGSFPALAQIRPDASLGRERSRVTPNAQIRGALGDRIDGGAIRGVNLFHSFTDFNVRDLQRVYFNNPSGIENILTRVTGNTRSNILGTLGVDGNANLFLINPNGILFGPNAHLDIRGAFLASTADRFTFADGNEFRASDTNAPPPVTVNIPIGVQFGSNPPAGLINEATLHAGGSITLAAGTVTNLGQVSSEQGSVTMQEAVSALPTQPGIAVAAIQPDTTLGSEQSHVTPQVDIQGQPGDRVDGGAVRGANLFHSFTAFNVLDFQRVYFANPTGVENILTRIIGSTPSNISGTLGVDGTANLFLLNPNGIIFGPNARLDIRGSLLASTGDRFTFPDGNEFSAVNPQGAPSVAVNIPVGVQYETGGRLSAISSTANLSTGQDLFLSAQQLNLQGQLQAGRNLTLHGQETVRIRDSATSPFVAMAGGQLLIQGDENIDIFALNHPHSGFASQGDMLLRSRASVGGDAHYWSGGNFRIEQLNGSPGSLFSPYDPIIRAAGDVSFSDYEGVSLHILAGGSVTVPGTIKITGADTTNFLAEEILLTDGTTVVPINGSTRPTLDIRSGTTAIGTPPGLTGTPSPNGLTLSPSITNADININAIEITAPNGLVLLTNQYQPATGLSGNITVGSINTRSDIGSGGSVFLDSRGDITLNRFIDTTSTFTGGNGIDTELFLFNEAGVLLAENDDSSLLSGAGGSTNNFDSYIDYIFPENGRYVIAVGAFDSFDTGGAVGGQALQAGNYNLQVSIQNHGLTGTNGRLNEVEANNTIGTAQNINNSFSNPVTLNPNIEASSTIPYVSIDGVGDGTFDYYRFDVTSNSQGIFDIDNTGDAGNAGNVTFLAAGDVSLNSSRISTSSRSLGKGGDIAITSGRSVFLSNGAALEARTSGTGNAGNIEINASTSVDISGCTVSGGSCDNTFTGTFSNITTSSDQPNSGLGGNITINTSQGNVLIHNGAFLDASTRSSSAGGNVTVNGNAIRLLDGGQILTTTFSDGSSGSITLNADTVEIAGVSPLIPNIPSPFNSPSVSVTPLIINSSPIPADPNIESSTTLPYTSVSNTGTNPAAGIYYSFDVASTGSPGIFDIDTTSTGLDTELFLFDRFGNLLATNDDSATTLGAGGSTNGRDSYIRYDFQAPGTYYIGIGKFNSFVTSSSNLIEGDFLAPTDSYTLQASVADPGVAPPSPVQAPNSGLFAQAQGAGTSGAITVNARQTTLNNGTIATTAEETSTGGGNIRLAGGTVSLLNNTNINAENSGPGTGGSIAVDLTGSLILDRSTISTSVTDPNKDGATGNGGNIQIGAETINLTNDASINASVLGSGQGGSIIVNTTGAFSLAHSSIATTSLQGATGTGGNIGITAGSLGLTNNARIDASNNGAGQGGSVAIGASGGTVNLTNSSISTAVERGATGSGGAIDVTTGSLTLSSGARFEALTRGQGNAGGIHVNASDTVDIEGVNEFNQYSGLLTSSETETSGRGGDIIIQGLPNNPLDLLRISDSGILSSRTRSNAEGGSITISNARRVELLRGGQMVTTAERTGPAGNIDVQAAESILIDGSNPNFVNVNSSQGGTTTGNGTVNEREVNDSRTSAQRIDSSLFSLQNNLDIESSTDIPHVSILGTGNNSFDYYSFQVTSPGSTSIFDIDHTNSVDTELFLFNSNGDLLATNDDADTLFGAAGSTSSLESYIGYTFKAPGDYVLGVGQYRSDAVDGEVSGTAIATGNTYTLQASLENRLVNPNQVDSNGVAISGLFAQSQGLSQAGTLSLNTEQLTVANQAQVTVSNILDGSAGELTIEAQDVLLNNQARLAATTEAGQGGDVVLRNLRTLNAQNNSEISASTNTGIAGSVSINENAAAANTVNLQGSRIAAAATGDSSASRAGNVTINAQGITLTQGGAIATSNVSSSVPTAEQANFGNIQLNNVNQLTVANSEISASTGSGVAGSVQVNATTDSAAAIMLQQGTIQATATSERGNAGSVTLNTQTLTARDRSEISASTRTGVAGSVSINANGTAADTVNLQGSRIEAEATGTSSNSRAGNITINARDVELTAGGSIATSNFSSAIPAADREDFGNIQLNNLNRLTVSGSSSEISASTATGVAGSININTNGVAADTVSLQGGRIEAEATGSNAASRAGNVTINAQDVELTQGGAIATRNISSAVPTAERGNFGNIQLNNVNQLSVSGARSEISASTQTGVAGSVRINTNENEAANTVTIQGGRIAAEATAAGNNPDSRAGNVTINAQEVTLTQGGAIATSNVSSSVPAAERAKFGNIQLDNVNQLSVSGVRSGISASTETGVAGSVSINANGAAADSITLQGGRIAAEATGNSATSRAGNVTINARNVELTRGGAIATQNRNSDVPPAERSNFGNIQLNNVDRLSMVDSSISASTRTGVAGNININTNQAPANLIDLQRSQIIARSTGENVNSRAGDVRLNARTVDIHEQSTIAASTRTGQAGSVSINALDTLTVRGDSQIAVTATGERGRAGNLNIRTGDLFVREGSNLTVSSEQGFAGNLTIHANYMNLNRGSVTAVTGQGDGGANINIDIVGDRDLSGFLWLENESLISASALGSATGGRVGIDADFIFAPFPTGPQGSDIIANAEAGDGGTVNVNALGLFGIQFRPKRTPLNDITASSEGGATGTVQLTTLGIDPSRGFTVVPLTFLDLTNLVGQSCSANLLNRDSTFTVAGRGGVPLSPIDPLGADLDLTDWVMVPSDVAVPEPVSSSISPTSLSRPIPRSLFCYSTAYSSSVDHTQTRNTQREQ